jgi:hypothetical protein
MADSEDRGRAIRGLWLGLCVVSLIGAGAAFGLGRYEQLRLQGAAERDARRLAVETLQPALTPADVEAPVRGERFAELLTLVRGGLLSGPIDSVRLWSADGVVLFANDRSLIGSRDAAMSESVHSVVASTTRSDVDGERFLTLTRLRVEGSEALVAAELERSHVRLVAEAGERWDPWVGRGLAAAGAFGALAVVTSLGLALARVLRRRRAARPAKTPPIPRASRDAAPATPEAPAYLLPGFQDEVQARRRVEEELEATTRERDHLAERCRRLEAELDEARDGRADGPALHRSAVAER